MAPNSQIHKMLCGIFCLFFRECYGCNIYFIYFFCSNHPVHPSYKSEYHERSVLFKDGFTSNNAVMIKTKPFKFYIICNCLTKISGTDHDNIMGLI